MSKVFFQYLNDKRQFITDAAMERWVSGALSLLEDSGLRGQVVELLEIENTPFEALENFYQSEEDAEENTQVRSG